MNLSFGEFFYILWNELAWLYLKWNEYIELFNTKPSRIDLMNRTAGQFFQIVNDALLGDCLLHIAQLTDSKKSGGQRNLTILRLPERIKDTNLKGQIKKLISIAEKEVKPCIDLRNKLLAQKDLDVALGTRVEPLEPPSRDKIENALKSIADVLNAISVYYTKSPFRYEYSKTIQGAYELLDVIDDGLRAKEERKKRIEACKPLPEDIQARDI